MTTQDLPPLPPKPTRSPGYGFSYTNEQMDRYAVDYARQCITTLKAENERLREEVAIRAQANRDDARHKDNYAHDLDKYAETGRSRPIPSRSNGGAAGRGTGNVCV